MPQVPLDREKPISSHELLQAFETLRRSLGPAMTDVVLEGLRMYGVNLEGKKAYSLNNLSKALNDVCGKDATSLIMHRIENRLRETGHKK